MEKVDSRGVNEYCLQERKPFYEFVLIQSFFSYNISAFPIGQVSIFM